MQPLHECSAKEMLRAGKYFEAQVALKALHTSAPSIRPVEHYCPGLRLWLHLHLVSGLEDEDADEEKDEEAGQTPLCTLPALHRADVGAVAHEA